MNQKISMRNTLFLIGIAFIFSFAIRLIWVYQFNGYEPYMFNGQFMISTNDGYLYAEIARDIIAGNELHYRDETALAISYMTVFFTQILNVPFESAIFYMSALFGSLIVVPLVLIGKALDKIEVGFIAALIASIALSYYNRTMVGYFDTDMLNIVLPTLLVWAFLVGIKSKEPRYILYTILLIILYRWWYPQSFSLEFAFVGIVVLYAIYKYYKQKMDASFEFTLLGFMLLAIVGADGMLGLGAIALLYVFYKAGYLEKYAVYFFLASVGIFLFAGGFDPIFAKLKGYIFQDLVDAEATNLKLHYYEAMQTVKESSRIPFDIFANRISGHELTFILSIVGYIWLCLKHKNMLLTLPLVGLGFLAYFAGLRFTIYAVPPMALGIGYLIYKISSFTPKPINYFLMILFTALALTPNIIHIIGYKVPTVFNKDEVKVLDQMKSIAGRDDYILSWWDYGYPIRYYSDVKTILDGKYHTGAANFPFSYAMKNSQEIAADILRADVEYEEQRMEKYLKYKDAIRSKEETLDPNIVRMILESGFKDANDFLVYLESGGEIKMPPKSREVYLFLPNDMLSIFPTISKFSEIDLMSGKMEKEPFFFMTRYMQDKGNYIDLSRGVALDKDGASILIGDTKITLNRFITTKYDKDMQLQINSETLNPKGELYAVFMSDYRQLLLLDEEMFNSTFVQLFVLQNYDEQYFKPIILTPFAKVYKLMQ